MSSYNTIGEDQNIIDRPLFGQSTIWDKISNYLCFGVPGLFIVITTLGAIIKPDSDTVHIKKFNIYFSFCLVAFCVLHYILMFWYRQGDIDPKFRFLIYANTVLIILLNVCAHLYIYAV